MPEENSEYFSEEGLVKLKAELEESKTTKRREIADRLEYAKTLGDLSENSEYQEAKESQIMNESRVAELEDILRRAVVVKKGIPKDTVEISSSVEVEMEDGSHRSFTIVGSQESAPDEDKISNESPLGKALLKHKVGDEVVVRIPRGDAKYKVVRIF